MTALGVRAVLAPGGGHVLGAGAQVMLCGFPWGRQSGPEEEDGSTKVRRVVGTQHFQREGQDLC